MNLQQIEQRMESRMAVLPVDRLQGWPVAIGYERTLLQMGSGQPPAFAQLDSYVVAIDIHDKPLTAELGRTLLEQAYTFARGKFAQDYPRWTWLLHMAAMGVISMVVSSHIEQSAIDFCGDPARCSKWMRCKVPVAVDASSGRFYCFDRSPRWGGMFYRHLKGLAGDVAGSPAVPAQTATPHHA